MPGYYQPTVSKTLRIAADLEAIIVRIKEDGINGVLDKQEVCPIILNHMVKNYSVDRDSDLDSVFHALSDSTRRAILERLAEEGDLMVTVLAEPFDMSLPAVSKHLRVLERAGLLEQDKDGRIRRCILVADPLQAAAGWINRYSRFWGAQFDALADYLERIQPEDDGPGGGD